MAIKDFNILGLKITSTNNKKDIAFVNNFNSYVQKIENICRLQKGELASNTTLGVDYYAFLFNPLTNKNIMEKNIASNIKQAIKDINSISCEIATYTESKITINVDFTIKNNLTPQPTSCQIEVDLV
jgi:hypothetical protein